MTPVLPALGQPAIGGLAAGAAVGAGDDVFAFEGVAGFEGVADVAGLVGVDAGVDVEVDIAFGIEAEVDVTAVAEVGRGEVAAVPNVPLCERPPPQNSVISCYILNRS
ncbi:MAG: hypothetical protein JF587_09925 [Catenulisporales bacterium]|nr:hypothetical protein [Catenulisporales bacterium]